jgi:hypothetical protein
LEVNLSKEIHSHDITKIKLENIEKTLENYKLEYRKLQQEKFNIQNGIPFFETDI